MDKITELRNDINITEDPIKKAILKEFLKFFENREQLEKNKFSITSILKEQNESLNKLEKLTSTKITKQAYEELLAENKTSKQKKPQDDFEKLWLDSIPEQDRPENMKNDTMNNKMLERINAEIEFMTPKTT